MSKATYKILVISSTPWDDNNSFGNSFSNIFGGNKKYEIANVFCKSGCPNTRVASRFFRINERGIIRSFFNKSISSGQEVACVNFSNDDSNNEDIVSSKTMAFFKIHRWQVFFWIRDLVWSTGLWKSEKLDDFIHSFNPDVIFQPIYYSSYLNRIALYAKQITKKPMLGYISDDNVTFRHFSLSPLFWIDRMIKVPIVKKAINECAILYTITETQKSEYDMIFGEGKCKVLFKGGHFDNIHTFHLHTPIRLVYTGNIGAGRWKTLSKIAQALEVINRDEVKAQLFIYTGTALSCKMVTELNRGDSSKIMGCVPVCEVGKIQKEADVLVHAESFELVERYSARLSFSTKIVDYFQAGKCILAVGWKETGAIAYLKKNDAAVVITDVKDIGNTINQIVANNRVIEEYAEKAFKCGCNYHRIDKIQADLFNDIDKYCRNHQ